MKKILKILFIIAVFAIISIIIINYHVKSSTNKYILDKNNLKNNEIDCILILGAGVWNEKPSPMLKDRLDKGINLYKKGISKKILMSGDHGTKTYDEVNIMKKYAIDKNIPERDIFMDHAGFSTYDSIYRLKHIFKVKSVLIISQKYHLYRAVYIAKKFNLKAYGSYARLVNYPGQKSRNYREYLARVKDFFVSIYKPRSKFLGKEIPINSNGNLTNDKKQ
ncbi:MAG: SanA/YdcF family protein [Bacillota bacterium]